MIMNFITLPCVWFIFPRFFASNFVGEIFALIVETLLFYGLSMLDPRIHKVMSLKKCLILSLLNNGLSFVIGEAVQLVYNSVFYYDIVTFIEKLGKTIEKLGKPPCEPADSLKCMLSQ
jgi:hypothetical protein